MDLNYHCMICWIGPVYPSLQYPICWCNERLTACPFLDSIPSCQLPTSIKGAQNSISIILSLIWWIILASFRSMMMKAPSVSSALLSKQEIIPCIYLHNKAPFAEHTLEKQPWPCPSHSSSFCKGYINTTAAPLLKEEMASCVESRIKQILMDFQADSFVNVLVPQFVFKKHHCSRTSLLSN